MHWLKAKAKKDRWNEECQILAAEMEWTTRFFKHRSSVWKGLLDDIQTKDSTISENSGLICYGRGQAQLWPRLAEEALSAFQNVVDLMM